MTYMSAGYEENINFSNMDRKKHKTISITFKFASRGNCKNTRHGCLLILA